MNKPYAVIYELAPDRNSWSAYVPDLPGCVCSAPSWPRVREAIRKTIAFHIEGMQLHGETIPTPSAIAEMVDVSAPSA